MWYDSIATVFTIFILIALGMAARRLKWISSSAADNFPKIIINISMPAQILITFDLYFANNIASVSPYIIFVPLFAMLTSFAVAFGMSYIIKTPKDRRGVFCVLSALSNSVFIGFPVIQGLFGNEAMLFAAFFFLSNTTLFWTLGYILIRKDGEELSGVKTKITVTEILRKLATMPMFAIITGLVLAILNIRLPAIITAPLALAGNLTTPLSMFFLGCVFYNLGAKIFKLDFSLVIAIVLRFFVSFGIMFLFCTIFNITGLARSAFCILSALPSMTQTGIVASMYGADKDYAAKGMALTTLLSVITIPLFMFLLS